MRLTDKKAVTTQRVLVYGAPKSGKTQLVGELAEKFNLLWFDCEQGWSTLLKLPTAWQERIDIISVPDSRVFPIAAETWSKVIKGSKVAICEEHGKVSCLTCKKDNKPSEEVELGILGADTIVVFDSLTQLTNSFISHITKNQPEDYKLQLDDWGNLRVLVDKFLSQVQAAGFNIVCITHEEEVEMEDGRKKIVPVSGSSKSSRNTAKYFDTIVYCDVKNKKHIFSSTTTSINGVITGSRTGQVLDDMKVPTLLEVFTGTGAVHVPPVAGAGMEVLKLSGTMREIPIVREIPLATEQEVQAVVDAVLTPLTQLTPKLTQGDAAIEALAVRRQDPVVAAVSAEIELADQAAPLSAKQRLEAILAKQRAKKEGL